MGIRLDESIGLIFSTVLIEGHILLLNSDPISASVIMGL